MCVLILFPMSQVMSQFTLQKNNALTHLCLHKSSVACPVNGLGGDEPYINPELFHL